MLILYLVLFIEVDFLFRDIVWLMRLVILSFFVVKILRIVLKFIRRLLLVFFLKIWMKDCLNMDDVKLLVKIMCLLVEL